MKKDYNLLILNGFNSVYVVNLVKNLKRENPLAHIYYWGEKFDTEELDKEYIDCFEEFYLFETKFKAIPIIRTLSYIYIYRKKFKEFTKKRHFDVINLHYVEFVYFFILDIIKSVCSKFVITPWGSDVYYVKKKDLHIVRRLYAAADFITTKAGTTFSNECLRKFHFNPQKLYSTTYFGSETVDYIHEHKKVINPDEAKRQLGIEGHYVITCGYKGEPGQQHLAIIEAINQVRDQLPPNLLLLFPFTYGGSKIYKQSVRDKVKDYKLNAMFVEGFVDIHKVFLLRQATDMYIHTLVDDSGGASLKEYLLCDKKTIKGAWLKFEDLEQDEVSPFFNVEKMSDLNKIILKAYHSEPLEYGFFTQKVLNEKGWKTAIKTWDEFYSYIS